METLDAIELPTNTNNKKFVYGKNQYKLIKKID